MGIRRYSLADFDRAMRHGIARDDHRLYPAMQFPSNQKLLDEDVQALYTFMLHGIKLMSRQNMVSEIP